MFIIRAHIQGPATFTEPKNQYTISIQGPAALTEPKNLYTISIQGHATLPVQDSSRIHARLPPPLPATGSERFKKMARKL
jgi:hypothetical protein